MCVIKKRGLSAPLNHHYFAKIVINSGFCKCLRDFCDVHFLKLFVIFN